MRIPDQLLPHRANITWLEQVFDPESGTFIEIPHAYNDVPTLVEEAQEVTRSGDFSSLVVATKLYFQADVVCPTGAKVTLPDSREPAREFDVIMSSLFTAPGLGMPESLLVELE